MYYSAMANCLNYPAYIPKPYIPTLRHIKLACRTLPELHVHERKEVSGKEQWAELEKEEEEADVIEDSDDQESADWSDEEESD